jgi:hypothetical protein
MLRGDLSGRFDYLFEPLEADDSAGDGDDRARRTLTVPDGDNTWSRRIVLAGVVLATLAAAAATAVALLQPAQPVQQVVIPADSTPVSTAASTSPPVSSAPPPAVTEQPVPVAPATVSTSAGRTEPATPTTATAASLVPEPTRSAGETAETMPPPPTTRAPISVSPESRAPFPNETPPRKDGQGGGLLGGLL